MHLLSNTIQRYAWGSLSAIPEFLGVAPDGSPQAELWIGAHPSAPSLVDGRRLDRLIADAPSAWLGTAVARRFHHSLPFLVKVLAAGQSLSLQAHPNLAQAQAGFQRENEAAIALDAPARLYRDANHKPEILCALSEFHALCGFRPVETSAALMDDLGTPATRRLAVMLRSGAPSEALRATVGYLTHLSASDRADTLAEVIDACADSADGSWPNERALAAQLAEAYPGDIGVVVALLLNLVRLDPGQAIYLDAGNLHAYLHGTGVEVMANSDNVLRGGLTPKHVDVDELLSVLDFEPLEHPVATPQHVDAATQVFPTAAPDFRLWVHQLGETTVAIDPWGPEILLCTQGKAILTRTTGGETLTLRPGAAAIVEAGERYAMSGPATVHRTTVGDISA